MRPDSYRLTTVTAAAQDQALTTLAAVRSDLMLSDSADDPWLARQVGSSSAAAANFCNRVFGAQGYQDVFRLAAQRESLTLARWPVVSVTTVTEQVLGVDIATPLLEGIDFEVDLAVGRVWRLDDRGNPCSWRAGRATVAYVAGYNLPGWTAPVAGAQPLPSDVEEAVIRLVKARWFARLRDPMVRRESTPEVYEAEYQVLPIGEGNLPPDVQDLLDNYRVPVIG